ncbi:aminopeptidase N-like [Ornithodoros turicata]|uniref:aminopeptidase N-like n=1 Tax=Ornithodoros turicata TaxID=34597 RepID=UPI00313914C1
MAEPSEGPEPKRKRRFLLLCLFLALVFILLAAVAAVHFRRSSAPHVPQRSAIEEGSGDGETVLTSAKRERRRPLAHTSLLLREDSLGLLSRRTSTQSGHYAQRLPRNILPEHYDLEIIPFFAEDRQETNRDDLFRGRVSIFVDCVLDTNTIVLHASHLSIITGEEPGITVINHHESQTVGYAPERPLGRNNVPEVVPVTEYHIEPNSDLLYIRLAEVLRRGYRYALKINFQGSLGDTRGFYKYHYDLHGKPQHLVVTFFEPTFAREAFPCFDEPDLKSTFTVTLLRPVGYRAISTMPVVRSEVRPDTGLVADHFMTTPRMSTYTLAFVITNYTATTDRKVSIWTHPDDAAYSAYALHITPKILHYFESIFDCPYALPKLDLVALPSFLVDAMENWGLLTFHKQSLLIAPSRSLPINLLTTASVVSHELAHQWFGNLVTMRWWNDIWLNEGFAAYMQYLGVDSVHPEWNIMQQFTVTDMYPIMKVEYNSNGHPLSITGNISTELDALFDRIVYNKGPSLVRMMSYFLTPKVFLQGIQSYLNKYRMGNAQQDDLFQQLTEASVAAGMGVDVKAVMDTWTKQAGYPVVQVERNYRNGTAMLTQMHHSHYPVQDRLWHIPITYTDSQRLSFDNTRPQIWMAHQREVHLNGLPIGEEDWVILNLQSAGYYKINYDVLNWELLRRQLHNKPEVIPVLNRAQLLQDVSDLAQTGSLGYDVALGILDYVHQEQSYAPLKTVLNSVEEIDGKMRATQFYRKWQLYMANQLKGHYDKLSRLTTEIRQPPSNDLLRKDVMFWSCQFGYRPCVQHCVRSFRAFMNNSLSLKSALEQDLGDSLVVLCHAIRMGDATDWRFLLDHMRDAETPDEAHVILSALGCSKDATNLGRLLTSALFNTSSPNLKTAGSESVGLIFESVTFSEKGSQLALQFLVQNWNPLLQKFGHTAQLRDTIWFALQSIRKSEDLEKMTAFYSKNVQLKKNTKRLAHTFESALETARSNIRWATTYGRTIEKWLDRKITERKLTAPILAAQIVPYDSLW